jgi:hypothetical protein
MTPGHALQRAEQVIIKALTGRRFAHLFLASGGLRGFLRWIQ